MDWSGRWSSYCLYGVSRQQSPSRPINATDHRTSFSLVLSKPPCNVLCTTYQESLMYLKYICCIFELLSLRGWFHRHFAKQNDTLYILPTLWPRNLTHSGRRSTSTGVEKCTRADAIGSHDRESLELEFMCSWTISICIVTRRMLNAIGLVVWVKRLNHRINIHLRTWVYIIYV